MALRQRFCMAVAIGVTWCLSMPARAATQPEQAGPEVADDLDPIIVTARRREEDMQRIPVSVVALNDEEIEARSITNLRALQNFVPNLTLAPSQNIGDAAGNIFIRGIGQEDFAAGSDPGVGFYLDGIYIARTMGSLIDLIDVARIEVLRGPQGTLYGKNTIGGAINVISVKPEAEFDANAGVILGNLGRLELRGMVNAPLTDTLFVRIALGRVSRDGYLKRLSPPFEPTPIVETNRRTEGSNDASVGRLQLRWLAGPTLTVDVSADASRRRASQSATHVDAVDPRFGILPAVNDLIRRGILPGPEISSALATDDLLTSYAGGSNSIAQDIEGIAATATKDIGSHSIRLITAYRRLNSEVATDIDGTWFTVLQGHFVEQHRQYSAELQASGQFGRLNYTAGLFAQRERTRTHSLRGLGRTDILYLCGCYYTVGNRPIAFYPRRELSGDNLGAYGQSSVEITDGLTATFGGRFSQDWKWLHVEQVKLDADTLTPTDTVLRSGTNRGRWKSFTWRGGIEVQATPDVMVYASVAEGYKSGGFNGRPVANLPNLGLNEYQPETAVTYEAGIRSEWFGRRLRVNATLFHTSYRDIQLRQQSFVGGVVNTLIENAARARIRGVELDVAARIGNRFTANFAYGHLDPEYLDVGQVPNLTLDTSFQRTPRNSFTASLDYSLPLGAYSLALHGDFSYRSNEQFQLLPSAFDQSGYGLLGARMTLRGPSERWSVAVFGTNIANERYRAAGRGTGLGEVGFANSVIGLPRQVGMEFRLDF